MAFLDFFRKMSKNPKLFRSPIYIIHIMSKMSWTDIKQWVTSLYILNFTGWTLSVATPGSITTALKVPRRNSIKTTTQIEETSEASNEQNRENEIIDIVEEVEEDLLFSGFSWTWIITGSLIILSAIRYTRNFRKKFHFNS